MSNTSGRKPTTPEDLALHPLASRGTRETIESIVIAVILAFLFRGFEAEAFVIPTGSMATTLMGRHVDVECQECGHRYRVGASVEEKEAATVTASTCPVCRHTMPLDYFGNKNHQSFTGDRILVNKYAYDLGEPQRWDVIVFKYPGNAKQNYIKRLVGLPGEAIMVKHGDVYTLRQEVLQKLRDDNFSEAEIVKHFQIARKEPHKIKAMLQLVDDSNHIADDLKKIKWPSRWQPWSPGKPAAALRSCVDDQEGLALQGDAQQESWLRYRHFIPTPDQWTSIRSGDDMPWLQDPRERLIADFYAYNTVNSSHLVPNKILKKTKHVDDDPRGPYNEHLGLHWVGDLALECWVEVESESGEILLDLVEGGVRYECRLKIGGPATLKIDGGNNTNVKFESEPQKPRVSKKNVVRGKGRYRLRFANVDNQLCLWVNERVVQFEQPTTYNPGGNVVPDFLIDDRPNDLQPVGIGVQNASMKISRLRILRDISYTAIKNRYDSGYASNYGDNSIREIFDDPASHQESESLFASRETVLFPSREFVDERPYKITCLGPDQFFPMGDNSPSSQDGRLWSEGNGLTPGPEPYVERNLLIGKAVFVYWPHRWRPFLPNFKRMRFIR